MTGLRASTPWSGLASCSYSGGGNKSLRKTFLFQSSTVKQDDGSETWGSPAPQLFDVVLGLSSCLRTARTSPHRLWRYVVIMRNCSYIICIGYHFDGLLSLLLVALHPLVLFIAMGGGGGG